MSDFQLTDADKHTGLWLRLMQHFEDRLARARVRNDSAQLSEASTAALRGEIATLKSLIGLHADRTIIIDGERVRVPSHRES